MLVFWPETEDVAVEQWMEKTKLCGAALCVEEMYIITYIHSMFYFIMYISVPNVYTYVYVLDDVYIDKSITK
jgi:hypothetical protein